MRKLITTFLSGLLLASIALAQQTPPLKNEYPPGPALPLKGELPPDDTVFLIAPAPQIAARAGYAPFQDNSGSAQAVGVGAAVFLDGGRFAVSLQTNAVSGFDQFFAYAEGDLKGRFRVPLDSKHIFWGGFGANISGRGSTHAKIDSYLRVQPVGVLGTMFAIKSKGKVVCVFHAFAKAGLGIIDNQNQSVRKGSFLDVNFDNWARPSGGAEALAFCQGFKFIADAERIFSFGKVGSTDRAYAELSKTFPFLKNNDALQIGAFARAEGVIERGAEGLPAGHPNALDRTILRAFGGLEFRFW